MIYKVMTGRRLDDSVEKARFFDDPGAAVKFAVGGLDRVRDRHGASVVAATNDGVFVAALFVRQDEEPFNTLSRFCTVIATELATLKEELATKKEDAKRGFVVGATA